MKKFVYKSRNNQGKLITGSIGAESETEAISELRRRGLTIITMSQGRGATKSKSGSTLLRSLPSKLKKGNTRGKVKSAELVVMTRQLATMVSAGIPLVEGLEILESQAQSPVLRAVLAKVVTDVRSGTELSEAMESHPKVFSDIYRNMIRAGEASGQLDLVLSRLADYQEAAEALKGQIRSAMTYPVVSLVMVVGIALFLLIFIIPRFEEMFKSMNVDLPWITIVLLKFSMFLQTNMLLWSSAVLVAVVSLILYFRTKQGIYVKDWLLLKTPVFGPLFAKIAISRFSRTFATLIQSGVPILGALEIVQSTTGNMIFANAVKVSSEYVRQGEPLGIPLAKTGVFPPMVTKMISIGEKSGSLEALLEKIAEFYDQQVAATVKTLTSLIEPIMIGIMGALVGGMVMAIFLPIFKMIGGIAGR